MTDSAPTKEPPRADAEASKTDEGKTEEVVLFPSTGTFRPVVPLWETRGEAGDSVRGKQDEEEEETTLVPARVRARPAPLPQPPARRRLSWPVTVLTLVLFLAAGVLLEAARRNFRRAARNRQPPTAAQSHAPTESEAQAAAAPALADETTLPPAQASTADSQAASQAVLESAEVLDTPADHSNGPGDSKAGALKAGKTERLPAPSAERVREPEAAPPSSNATAGAVVKARAATAGNTEARSVNASKPLRRAEGDGPSSASASAQRPLPVSTPPPASKPRKVIQWP